MICYQETQHDDLNQRLSVDKLLHQQRTDHQELVIFENSTFGKVLALDGAIQTTERDEFIYHELLVHVPLFAHAHVGRVLIVGGGDGGTLRRVLEHPIERATMVEIDPGVIELSRRHLASISVGAFDDPRAELVVADGARFVAETAWRFDVIIVDSTDPVGPAKVLFGREFYADCRRCLNPGGILVTQSGVPFMQPEELRVCVQSLRTLFSDVTCYLGAVPTYNGGLMAFGWATDEPAHRRQGVETVRERYVATGVCCRYYNPEIHVACFALPTYVRELLGG